MLDKQHSPRLAAPDAHTSSITGYDASRVREATVREYRIGCCSYVLHLKWLSEISTGKSLICPCNHANLHYSSCPAAALVTHLCMFSSYLIAHVVLDCLKYTICVCRYSIWGISVSWSEISATGWNVMKDGDDMHNPLRMNPFDLRELVTLTTPGKN